MTNTDVHIAYESKVGIDHRKRFAQFFTPNSEAELMVAWATKAKSSLLDPSLGLGAFPVAARKHGFDGQISAFEIDPTILEHSANVRNMNVRNVCFLSTAIEQKFDAIVANPPYLKFHNFDRSLIATVSQETGVKMSGQSNIYALFILKCLALLAPGGRASFIVPTEFCNANYGIALKRELLRHLHSLIFLDYPVFGEKVQTTACIINCEAGYQGEIAIGRASSSESLSQPTDMIPRSSLDPEQPWLKMQLEASTAISSTSRYLRVNRGIATGDNSYFCLSHSKVESLGLTNSVMPCITKASHVTGHVFDQKDFQFLKSKDQSVYLFDGVGHEGEVYVADYIRHGEERGVHEKYLTSHRKPWYAIEQRRPPELLVGVFNRKGLRFIENRSGVRALTCFHSVYLHPDCEDDRDIIIALMISGVSQAYFARHQREYGGGLNKFEPNDLNKSPLPPLSGFISTHEKIVSCLDAFRGSRAESDLDSLRSSLVYAKESS